jgi:hypothetical protein
MSEPLNWRAMDRSKTIRDEYELASRFAPK